eukprot:767561-Hanusia_phi.AAC.2
MAALLRNKSVLKQAELMLEEALAEVEGVTKRMETGNEQRNIQAMIRESVNMIRALCEREEEECESFLEQGGIEIVMRVLLTPNIPIQTSICALSSALVKHEKVRRAGGLGREQMAGTEGKQVAKQLVARGLAAGLIDFMLVDDPHLQLEAATADGGAEGAARAGKPSLLLLRRQQRHRLRNPQGLGRIQRRAQVAGRRGPEHDGVACPVLGLEARVDLYALPSPSSPDSPTPGTRAVRALSFLALNDQALEQLHQHHISLRDFAAKNDSSLTTSALMLLLNASRHMRYARKMLDRELVDELVKLGVAVMPPLTAL